MKEVGGSGGTVVRGMEIVVQRVGGCEKAWVTGDG